MKVAIVTSEYPPHWGGMGTNAYHTARVLGARGVDVHVITRRGAPPPRLANVNVHQVASLPIPVHYAVSFARQAIRLVMRLEPDLVHFHSPCALPTRRGWDELDRARIPAAVTFHGSWRGERGALKGEPWHGLTANDAGILALSRRYEPLERIALRRAAVPVTVSAFAKRELAGYDEDAAERLVIVPNGVDARAFTPRDGRDGGSEGRVLSVGRLSGRKNPLALVEAAARVDPHLLKELTIVGRDGGLARAVLHAAARRDVPLNLVTRADDASLTGFYRGSDVFALPTRYEAQGIVFLEAMASGLPSVAGHAGGVPEVVDDGHTGVLVPPEDPQRLADALTVYLEDAALRRRTGAAARERADAFDWTRVTDRLTDAYKEVAP